MLRRHSFSEQKVFNYVFKKDLLTTFQGVGTKFFKTNKLWRDKIYLHQIKSVSKYLYSLNKLSNILCKNYLNNISYFTHFNKNIILN